MTQKFRKTEQGRRKRWLSWWRSLPVDRRSVWFYRGGVGLVVLAALVAGSWTLARLEAQVESTLLDRVDQPTLTFVDLPDHLGELALSDLRAGVADLMQRDWTEDSLCREMALRLDTVGWVARVNYVRRTADARFEVSARYRLPVAMVQQGRDFMLVDNRGVRLPGVYRYEPTWKLIQGVARPAPQPGHPWAGDDLAAGLAIIEALAGESFESQVTAVLVDNMAGRRDVRLSHLELATERAGGRIRWGSAPGREIEENTVVQKLAILRANYRDTGRIDAGYAVIDVSTFPDRYTVPG